MPGAVLSIEHMIFKKNKRYIMSTVYILKGVLLEKISRYYGYSQEEVIPWLSSSGKVFQKRKLISRAIKKLKLSNKRMTGYGEGLFQLSITAVCVCNSARITEHGHEESLT